MRLNTTACTQGKGQPRHRKTQNPAAISEVPGAKAGSVQDPSTQHHQVGGPPNAHASPSSPAPTPGGAPATAFASLGYTLPGDPPLASGQSLLIRALEPRSATKVG